MIMFVHWCKIAPRLDTLYKKRKKKGWSLEKLGLETGLTRMHIHRIEKGYNITLTTLLKLSIALVVDPQELLKTDLRFKPEDLERLVNSNKSNRKKIPTKVVPKKELR
jgi:transcriptional regulator with XRE-family HTH domain